MLSLSLALSLSLIACSGSDEAEDMEEVETEDDAVAEAPRGKGKRGKGKRGRGGGDEKAGDDTKVPGDGPRRRVSTAPGTGTVTNGSIDFGGAENVATVEKSSGRMVSKLPTSKCFHTTATPIVVGEWLLFGTHKKKSQGDGGNRKYEGCNDDTVESALYAVSAKTGEAHVIGGGLDAEAAASWGDDKLWVPLVGGGGLAIWDGGDTRVKRPINAATDSAGLWDDARDRYIFGSVNVPQPVCQGTNGDPRPDCGCVVAVDADGTVHASADRRNGLRGWIAAGPTGTSDAYYVGLGNGEDGENSLKGNPMRACDLVKLRPDLTVEASYDDGIEGCSPLGRVKSAVVGEVPIVDGKLWVQYLGSTDGQGVTPIVQLNADDLSVVCRAEIPARSNASVASFYQAPVVDERGNAYVASERLESQRTSSLYRITPDCSVTRLVDGSDHRVGTPTLADDKWVLFGDAGKLHVVDRDSGKTTSHALGSDAGVIGGAVITRYGVSVVSVDNTVTTFTDLGISGYGKAPWPRFRKTNTGDAFE